MVPPLIPLAVIALLGLIALLTGTHFISLTVRDIVTGESEDVALADANIVNDIINDPTLTFDEKMALLKAMRDKNEIADIMHKLLIIVIIVAVAFIATQYMKGMK